MKTHLTVSYTYNVHIIIFYICSCMHLFLRIRFPIHIYIIINATIYKLYNIHPIPTALISLILPIYRFGMVSSRRTVVECVNKTRTLTLMLLVVVMVKSIPPSTFESLDSKSVKRALLELVGLYQLAGAVATTTTQLSR